MRLVGWLHKSGKWVPLTDEEDVHQNMIISRGKQVFGVDVNTNSTNDEIADAWDTIIEKGWIRVTDDIGSTFFSTSKKLPLKKFCEVVFNFLQDRKFPMKDELEICYYYEDSSEFRGTFKEFCESKLFESITFVSLCEAVRKLDDYGYWITPSGKLVPVASYQGHIDLILDHYKILPESAQNLIDKADGFVNNREELCDWLSEDCEKLYSILMADGWVNISTSDTQVLYFRVKNETNSTKKKIANAILDLPKSVLNMELSIYNTATQKQTFYDSCRNFLRGDE